MLVKLEEIFLQNIKDLIFMQMATKSEFYHAIVIKLWPVLREG